MGIKTVNAQDQVEFHEIGIAHSEANGVWVTGLPEATEIIVIGQGYVSAGQTVQTIDVRPEETALAAGKTATRGSGLHQ
jgi:multidrug efflux system membrane fusion protein